jgi:hypothetical protein
MNPARRLAEHGHGTEVQLLTGAGEISSLARYVLFTSTGASQVLTIQDGLYDGQPITVTHFVDGGSGVVTASSAGRFASTFTALTLTNVGEHFTLVWCENTTTIGWAIITVGPVAVRS